MRRQPRRERRLRAVWGVLEGEHRRARCGFATLLALGVSIFVLSQGQALGETRAATTDPAAVGEDLPAPYRIERYLVLSLPPKLKVGTPGKLLVYGFAEAGDELSVFVDPKGKKCPSSASARPAYAIPLVSEPVDAGAFRVNGVYTPQHSGDRTVCAYLGSASDQVNVQANVEVAARRLRASVAQRTVRTALNRHGFARRVVKAVQRDCRRRSGNVFACEFSGGFPGYHLKGRGQVRLGVDLSYRFRVKAQGVRFTLTDENEEPRRSN